MRSFALAAIVLVALTTGCRQDMHDNPRYEPLEHSQFFPDGRSARPKVVGTVARGAYHTNTAYWEGVNEDGTLVVSAPVAVDETLLARGRQRFEIFCSPCHGRLGDAEGMIVQRGLKPPPSYHIDRLRSAPDGRIFEVISNGFGRMESFRDRVPTEDRWAIVAYVRALQLSQFAPLGALPATVETAFHKGVEDQAAQAADHGAGHGAEGEHGGEEEEGH